MKISKQSLIYALEERQRFEMMLLEISGWFINIPVDQIDRWIEKAQRRVCECFELDLSGLWQWSLKKPSFLTMTHLHSPPDGPRLPTQINAKEAFPWLYEQVFLKVSGFSHAFSTEGLPEQAARDKETLRHYGVKSTVVLPLSTGGGEIIGLLTFDTLWKECFWSDELVKRLTLVAEIFSNALARKKSDEALHKNEMRLTLAADSAKAGLWELDYSTRLFWTTQRTLSIFGYNPDEVISFKRFEETIYPGDRVFVQRVLAQSLAERSSFSIEFRIVFADGSIKWICSSGQPYYTSNGEPECLMGLSIDITKRKMLERQMLESSERLAAAIDVAEVGFYEMDAQQKIRFLDNRIRQIIGITEAEEPVAREFWLKHIHPEDLQRVTGVTQRVLQDGVDKFLVEYRYIHPDRRVKWFQHLSQVLVRDADGKATRVTGVLRDITERKQAEEFLQKNEVALRNSQKDLQRLAGRMIAAKEEELRRLSRELHDDLTQRLAVMAIELGKLELNMKKKGNLSLT